MTYTESDYIEAGRRYERAPNPDRARAEAQHIRVMLSSENPKDAPECRRLIEIGRSEARQ